MLKIVADDRIPFLKGVLEPYAQVVYLPGKVISSSITKGISRRMVKSLEKSPISEITTTA